jgi:transposase-like protein
VCLDLSAPEPVVVKVVKAKKARPAKPRARKPKKVNTCAGCSEVIAPASTWCKTCANLQRRSVTPEQDIEIAALYLEVRSAKKVAKHFDISQFAVAASLDRMGVPRPGRGVGGGGSWRLLSETIVDRLVAAYESGESVASICKREGLADKTVYKALRSRDAVQSMKGRTIIASRAFTPEQDEEIAAAYRNGGTILGLAKLHGVSQPAVRAALVRAGATLRKQGQRAA